MGLFDFFRSKSNDSVPVRNKVIQKLSYCGPKYTVARFKIDKSLLPTKTKALLVAQEGHCIDERYL